MEIGLLVGTGNKENAAPSKEFNASNRGQGLRYEEQNKDEGWKPLQCWTCGGEHHRGYFPQHLGGRPWIYSAQEAQKVGDVGKSIPKIYAALDNRHIDH